MADPKHIESAVIITEEQIKTRVKELSKELSAIFVSAGIENSPLLFLVVMNGAFIFAADFIREVNSFFPHQEMDSVFVSSYGGNLESNEKPTVQFSNKIRIEDGFHVVILEDVIDKGFSLKTLIEELQKRNPHSITIISLLEKIGAAIVPIPEEIKVLVGFQIDKDDWVFGYGIDSGERWRGLPDINVK